MNNFFKYGLMTAGVSMVVGIVFALISTAIGGRIVLKNSGWLLRRLDDMEIWDEIEDWSESHHNGWHFGWWKDDSPKELKINGKTQNNLEPIKETQDLMVMQEPGEISAVGIRKLDLDLGAGQFYIREKDTDDGIISILVQGVGTCDYYTDKDTLHVESFKGNHFIGEDLSKNQIIMDLPKGISFDEVELTCGAAMVELGNMNAKELEVEVGAGEVRINYADVNKFSANIGAGRVEANGMAAQKVDLQVGMGDCVYNGSVSEDLEAECDLGNMDIMLQGEEEDYNYEIECAAGNVDLGGRSITALAAEKKIYNGAPATIELSCSMGNITVSFFKQ